MRNLLPAGVLLASACFTVVLGKENEVAQAKKEDNVTCVKRAATGSHVESTYCFSNEKNDAVDAANKQKLNEQGMGVVRP